MKIRNSLLGAALVMGFALGGAGVASAGDIGFGFLPPFLGFGERTYGYLPGHDAGGCGWRHPYVAGCRHVRRHPYHYRGYCHYRRHRCGWRRYARRYHGAYHGAKAYGYHGLCGWPYAFRDGCSGYRRDDAVYFALGNGWPFCCKAGDAGDWPYYHGVGVGVKPDGKKFGFAYNFKPYAICRQAHGPRFCRRHFLDFQHATF